jgi:hypothetical protein
VTVSASPRTSFWMVCGRTFMARAIRVESWPMAISERSRQVVPPASSRVLALVAESAVIGYASRSVVWVRVSTA